MIEEILDRLERIDHKEYCGGFEFADSSTFEEMGKCFDERKKLANYTKELQQENKQLKEKIDILLEDNNQLEEIRIKAINFIENECAWELLEEESEELLEILGDKENE